MTNDTQEVLNVIYSVMGSEPVRHNRSRYQISYNCPACDGNRNKGNLEINYGSLVMKCWSCGQVDDGMSGSLYKLVKGYGNENELRLYKEATKDFEFAEREKFVGEYIPDLKLPNEFRIIDPQSTLHTEIQAYNYIHNRGISDDQIFKYKIGFCASGQYSGRIIIPSYDSKGRLNFFISRTYVDHKQKYNNPEVPKTEIIVNEANINWDSTIYIVEGIFDMIGLGLDNVIPLLGKYLSDKVYEALTTKCKGYVVVCLDPDAKKDAYHIYQRLDTSLSLNGKVRVIDLPLDKDIAEIKESFGEKGVLKCIRKMRKLDLTDKVEYNLI